MDFIDKIDLNFWDLVNYNFLTSFLISFFYLFIAFYFFLALLYFYFIAFYFFLALLYFYFIALCFFIALLYFNLFFYFINNNMFGNGSYDLILFFIWVSFSKDNYFLKLSRCLESSKIFSDENFFKFLSDNDYCLDWGKDWFLELL